MNQDRLTDANRRHQEHTERPFASRTAHAVIGTVAGFALAVRALLELSSADRGSKGGLLLAAGAFFGMIVGLDLHSTRTWLRLGKYTFAVRFILACSAGGAATGLAGIVLGLVGGSSLWQYSLGGAALGTLLLVWAKLETISLLSSDEKVEPPAPPGSQAR